MFGIKSKVQKYLVENHLKDMKDVFSSKSDHLSFEAIYTSAIKEFTPVYTFYTSNISSREMAISLELAATLYSLCKVFKPSIILDLGSGLSSYIFRTYQKEEEKVLVYSVDDDADWLHKTECFLAENNLNTTNLYTLDTFPQSPMTKYDLIFHDLNLVEERIKHVQRILGILGSGGLAIFDDVHKIEYLWRLDKSLRQYGLPIYNLKEYTADQYGRYSILAKSL